MVKRTVLAVLAAAAAIVIGWVAAVFTTYVAIIAVQRRWEKRQDSMRHHPSYGED
jgi:hypothetical protein